MSELTEVISFGRLCEFSNQLTHLIDRLTFAQDNYFRNHPVSEPEKDARHRTYNLLIRVLRPIRLGLMFAAEHFFDDEWWASVGKSPDSETVEEFTQLLKISLSNNIYIVIERSFRLCLRNLEPAACGKSNNEFSCVYNRLFHLLKLNHLEDTLLIAGLIRNTLHHNGVYSPRDDKGNRTFEYQGHKLDFIVGEPIEFADWVFLIILVADLIGACMAVLEHPKIVRLPHVRDPWV